MLQIRGSCQEQKVKFTSFSDSWLLETLSFTAIRVCKFSVVPELLSLSVVLGLLPSFSVVLGLLTSFSVVLRLVICFAVVLVLLTSFSAVLGPLPSFSVVLLLGLVTSSGRRDIKLFAAVSGVWIKGKLSADGWWSCPFDELGTE